MAVIMSNPEQSKHLETARMKARMGLGWCMVVVVVPSTWRRHGGAQGRGAELELVGGESSRHSEARLGWQAGPMAGRRGHRWIDRRADVLACK